tara:strand:- start:162 stop:803 length:642 start_codon:yes stop_codon:yes gene_type:complete
MKIKVYNKKMPYFVIDDYYTEQELKSVWSEIDFYTNSQDKDKILRAEKTDYAARKKGISQAKSYRWYPEDFLTNYGIEMSPLFRLSNKLSSEELHSNVKDLYPWYNMFANTNVSDVMLSYYEEGDYYKPHIDIGMWTQLIWVTKKSKKWKGGDFCLYTEQDKKKKISWKNNRSIIFPSMLKHEVEPIVWKDVEHKFGDGRYTISYFLYWAKQE